MDNWVDVQALHYNRQIGEWSEKTEEAFNKHLKRLDGWIKGRNDYEPLWRHGAKRPSKT